MDWILVAGPIATVLAAIVASTAAVRSTRSSNRLAGQELLNRTLQEDNKIQRDLTAECRKQVDQLEQRVDDLESEVIVLKRKGFTDELTILHQADLLAETEAEFRTYKETHP